MLKGSGLLNTFASMKSPFVFGVLLLPLMSSAVPNQCDCISRMKNFNVKEYLGRWYEVESKGNIWEQVLYNCPTADYSLDDNGNVIVLNSGLLKTNGALSKVKGIGVPDGDAKLMVSFKLPGFSPTAPYCILGTDYKNWAVVWSCIGGRKQYFESMWILTRSKEPLSDEMKGQVDSIFKDVKLNRTGFTKINQSKCNI